MSKKGNSSKHRFPIANAILLLRKKVREFSIPAVEHYSNTPFRTLVSTLLSLRTKDATTIVACRRLFEKADTPEKMLSLPEEKIRNLIFPVGFYKVKAKTIHHVCRELIGKYRGEVPADLDRLLSIKGIGRKTANLVLTAGFNLPGICVDTHVHRISNRWGYVKTSTPEETEMELREILPIKYWIEYNGLLVTWGQNVCLPVSPRCSTCPLSDICPKKRVERHR